jgi:hypothetical protein
VHQLHHQDGLAHAGAAEEAGVAAARQGGEQIEDLETCLKDLFGGAALGEGGGGAQQRAGGAFRRRAAVEGAAEHVEDPAAYTLADGHREGLAGDVHGLADGEAAGVAEGDRLQAIVGGVAGDLEDQRFDRVAAADDGAQDLTRGG